MNSYSGSDPQNYNLIDLGVTLQSDEYPESINTKSSNLYIKNHFSDTVNMKSITISLSDSERRGETVSHEAYMDINSGESVLKDTPISGQWSLANPATLQGKSLYLHFECMSRSSLVIPKNRLQILYPIFIELETAYLPVNITFSNTTGGYVNNISGSYPGMELIGLHAIPSYGYKFNRWIATDGVLMDALSPTSQYIVPRLNSATVTAYFEPISNFPQAGRYNGSSWNKVVPMRYNGTSWVECEYKRYNGSSWDNVDTN